MPQVYTSFSSVARVAVARSGVAIERHPDKCRLLGYRTTGVTAASCARNRLSALGLRNTWSTTWGAWLAIAALRIGRL